MSTSSYTPEEQRALAILAELYSGFYDEKVVARDLAGLKGVPVERMEELLRFKLHPALYTQLAWRGSGFESQKAYSFKELEAMLADSHPERMSVVTKFLADKFWSYNLDKLWTGIKFEIGAIRQRQAEEEASRPF